MGIERLAAALARTLGLPLVLMGVFAAGPAGDGRDARGDRGDRDDRALRRAMVEEQVRARGVSDPAVLAALTSVPRHLFIPPAGRAEAYGDHPLPIGHGQTISQPYIVGLMTELSRAKKDDKVLEIGTGSGYQAAVLAELGALVFSIEIVAPLGERARQTLADLGYDNVRVRVGDGYRGWPEEGPFDAIVLTAAPPHVPAPLVEQLKVGGRLVVPVGGGDFQELVVLTKKSNGETETEQILPVRFVPMTGEAENPPRKP